MKPRFLAARVIAPLCLALAAGGCSVESLYHLYPIPFYDTHPHVKRTRELSENPPRKIAILPFTFTQGDNPERRQAVAILRDSVYRALSRLRSYEVIPLPDVDRRLEQAGVTARALRAQSPESLGKITGADALFYGDLERTANITLFVYSHTVYEGRFRVVDASGGEPLWTARLWEGRRAGLIVEGFLVDMILTQTPNRKVPDAYRPVAESMAAKLIARIPEPGFEGTVHAAAARETP